VCDATKDCAVAKNTLGFDPSPVVGWQVITVETYNPHVRVANAYCPQHIQGDSNDTWSDPPPERDGRFSRDRRRVIPGDYALWRWRGEEIYVMVAADFGDGSYEVKAVYPRVGTYLAEAPDLTYTRAQDLPPQMK
jgi:hypothetical protein